jgi:hypothetical protein
MTFEQEILAVLRTEVMSPATCAVLTGVFPLVLLTAAVDRALISVKIRRLAWFRSLVVWTVSSAAIGLLLCVLGVQLDGLDFIWGVMAWAAFATAFVGLGASIMASIATHEVEEDRAKQRESKRS